MVKQGILLIDALKRIVEGKKQNRGSSRYSMLNNMKVESKLYINKENSKCQGTMESRPVEDL